MYHPVAFVGVAGCEVLEVIDIKQEHRLNCIDVVSACHICHNRYEVFEVVTTDSAFELFFKLKDSHWCQCLLDSFPGTL